MTIAFDDYRTGSLPDVCVFTGKPTPDRMVLRTRIVERELVTKAPGPVLRALTATTLFESPRAPRNLLVGKLPVEADHLFARGRRQRNVRIGGWLSLFLLVVAAVSARPWSPWLAVASIAAMIVVLIARVELRRDVPTPTLVGAGTLVHLANVHQDFVEALSVPPSGQQPAR